MAPKPENPQFNSLAELRKEKDRLRHRIAYTNRGVRQNFNGIQNSLNHDFRDIVSGLVREGSMLLLRKIFRR